MKKQLDVSNLVDEPVMEDYQNKPVENYGMSLLKNMGFDPSKGIGKNKTNQLQTIFQLKPRPKGQGLGAQSLEQPKYQQLQIGDKVLIVGENHKGLTGCINEVLKDKQFAVQLYPSRSIVKINRDGLKKISKAEMKKLQSEMNEQGEEKKKKKIKWILPQIRVKVIDPKSQYYLKKLVVCDVLTDRDFQCRDENGKTIQILTERDVQTVVPKTGQEVLIVQGKHKGAKATVIDRKKSKGTVTVQTCEDLQMIKLGEDDICQFVQL